MKTRCLVVVLALLAGPVWSLDMEDTAAPVADLILLDVVHGGRTPGVNAGGIVEALLVKHLAEKCAALLRGQGLRAELTQVEQRSLSPIARVEWANQSGAAALLALHVNYSFSEGSKGIRLFTSTTGPLVPGENTVWKNSQAGVIVKSKKMSQALAAELLPASRRRQAQQSLPLAMFRGLALPAVMLELGFASHPADLAALQSKTFIADTAEGLARGLLQYLDRKWVPLEVGAP